MKVALYEKVEKISECLNKDNSNISIPLQMSIYEPGRITKGDNVNMLYEIGNHMVPINIGKVEKIYGLEYQLNLCFTGGLGMKRPKDTPDLSKELTYVVKDDEFFIVIKFNEHILKCKDFLPLKNLVFNS